MNHPSPYVRRRWLGLEIRRLRGEHGMTGETLAHAVGFSRQQLSLLETGRPGPDIDLVSGICDYLAVGANRRRAIMDAAADGWAPGWWTASTHQIGLRQATYADLESGTSGITEYALALIPGLLQTAKYAAARIRSDPVQQSDAFDPAAAIAARAHRQQLLLAPGGPRYEVILDEIAVRRSAVEPHIMADQLRHIADVSAQHPTVSVRILPTDATITGHSAPRSAYSIYRYPSCYRDTTESVAVAVDTLTCDLIHTELVEIGPYLNLHRHLKAAALGAEPTMHMLHAIAQELVPIKGAA